jgi:thioesterase domain-containing protein
MMAEKSARAQDHVADHAERSFQQTSTPTLFLLPALIDDDPHFDEVWNPIRDRLHIVRVSYLDWTELVQPGMDFSAVVSHVKRQIETEAPAGPLLVAGYSIGGCLAYACALAFQAEGRPVQLVGILDAPANIKWGSLPRSKRLRNRVRSIGKFHLRGTITSILAKVLTKGQDWPLLRKLSRFRHSPLPFKTGWYLHRKLNMQMELRLFRPWWRSMTEQNSSRLLSPAVVFRSADYDNFKDESLGWSEYCLDCTTIRVAGEHGSMLHAENNGPLLSKLMEMMTTANFAYRKSA